MKICIYSPKFYPSVGGLENLTLMLAKEFQQLGHIVTVITKEFPDGTDAGVCVYYRPSFFKMLSLFYHCDVFYMPNISLGGSWLMLFNPFKRWVLSHNGWYERSEGVIGWQDKLKLFLTRFASVNISVSRVVADHLPVQSIVIHNCYDAAVFFKETGTARNKNVLFVGRLVSDKGAALLLDACIQLWNEGMKFSLTITGDGPEKNMLETKAGTHYPVHFTGAGKNGELRKIYNQHLILVVPSAWKEPFGIVALEGLACGCKVLCSDEGGLPEAVNGFGSTFKRNSITALKEALKKILVAEDLNKDDRELDSFLQKHTPANVARQYIEVLTGGTRMISS